MLDLPPECTMQSRVGEKSGVGGCAEGASLCAAWVCVHSRLAGMGSARRQLSSSSLHPVAHPVAQCVAEQGKKGHARQGIPRQAGWQESGAAKRV